MHWLDLIRTCRSGLVLRILNSIQPRLSSSLRIWQPSGQKRQNHNMSQFLLLQPQSTWLSGEEASSVLLPAYGGGGGDGDSELLTTTPAQRVVHTAKVFTAHKCRSKLIHSGNTEKKALTDCLMCWHSYKLLDKKSNTLSLFSSPYNIQSCFQEKTGAVSERLNATLQVRTARSGGDGLGCERKVGPGFEGMRGCWASHAASVTTGHGGGSPFQSPSP